MPASSSHPWLMFLSGLGLAGSVLGAVVAAFALASGVVAFGVWPADRPSVESDPLKLEPAGVGQRGSSRTRALVLPAAGTAAAAGATATAAPASARSRRATARRRARAARAGGDGSTGYSRGAPSTRPIAGRPGDPAPETPPDRRPLAPVGGAVDDTTRSLGDTVRGVTRDLGNTVGVVSPPLGAAVTNTGAALATTIQNVGSTIAALLGHTRPAPQRPQPGH